MQGLLGPQEVCYVKEQVVVALSCAKLVMARG